MADNIKVFPSQGTATIEVLQRLIDGIELGTIETVVVGWLEPDGRPSRQFLGSCGDMAYALKYMDAAYYCQVFRPDDMEDDDADETVRGNEHSPGGSVCFLHGQGVDSERETGQLPQGLEDSDRDDNPGQQERGDRE